MDKSRVSLEITFDRVGDDVRVTARSSRGEALRPRALGVDLPTLRTFTTNVQRAAALGRSLETQHIVDAQTIRQALLAHGIGELLAQVGEATAAPVLVRLYVSDPELQTVPWEATCTPGEALGFWGTSPRVFPVRGVSSAIPWQAREIRGAVKVLAIAPTGSSGLTNLKQALDERFRTGEIEWLDPMEDSAANVQFVLDRLRREPVPNILHFLGHGTVDDRGRPALRLGDHDDQETWLPVELLAQSLAASFRNTLRLVVLEACEGAKPSAYASAAEILARAGVDAVVAHAWPVRADVARTCSTAFYRAITDPQQNAGDVTVAMNQARRAVIATHEASAAGLGPVLYLRGPNGKIFDFKGRKVTPPKPNVTGGAGANDIPKSLIRLVRGKFSLVLGDRWRDDSKPLDDFRKKLQQELSKVVKPPEGLPMSMLAQWFALRNGLDKLGIEFQKMFRASMEPPTVVTSIAKLLPPGVHTTLWRNPWLELSLAEAQPQRDIYVIQPNDSGATVLLREKNSDEWKEIEDGAPSDLDLDEIFLILRPYRGYTPELAFTRPLLTEDDYYLRLRELWNPQVISVDLKNAMQTMLAYQPALILGLSLLTANHRLLLQNLYARGLPRNSLAVVGQEDQESVMWKSGAGLPGRDEGIEVLDMPAANIGAVLAGLAEEAQA